MAYDASLGTGAPRGTSSAGRERLAVAETLGFVLGVADQVCSALWREHVEHLLTQPQFLALAELYYSAGASQYQVADNVGIDRVTIGPVLKRFEDARWVERRRDARDSRKMVLTLLPAGLDRLHKAAPQVDRVTDAFLSPLTHTEQAMVTRIWAMLGQLSPPTGHDTHVSALDEVRAPAFYPWFFLRIARRRYKRIWREVVGEEITPPQFALMCAVVADPGIDIRTAAARVFIEESTAVRIVMRSVRLRLMRDTRHPDDARRSLLRLTDLGETGFRTAAALIPAVQQALTADLPPRATPDVLRLTRLVARLAD